MYARFLQDFKTALKKEGAEQTKALEDVRRRYEIGAEVMQTLNTISQEKNKLYRELVGKTLTEEDRRRAAQAVEKMKKETGEAWKEAAKAGGVFFGILLLGMLIILILQLSAMEMLWKKGKK